MPASRLEYLFTLYVNQKCSLQQEEELMELVAKPENEAAVKILIDHVVQNTGSELQMPNDVANSILQNILKADKGLAVRLKSKKITFVPRMRIAAAAMIILIAGAAYWFVEKKNDAKDVLIAEKPMQILPGGEKAMLTMADGSTITLDSMQNGTFAQQGSTHINKQGGLLIYNANASSNSNAPVVYNTLSTPRGGQYGLVLPDGSKVWLNAASSLRFPAAFTGSQREVELTGEAYFEVKPLTPKEGQGKVPFFVQITSAGEKGQIEVLGTHFNINAYADEAAIKTTLLEGAVRVRKGQAHALLAPGQQAQLLHNGEIKLIKNADVDEVVAWKNGIFQFENADITTIMRQVGRWYDVEVIYAGKIPVRRFDGKISRNAQLSEVLQILELSNITFTVDGKKIIVH